MSQTGRKILTLKCETTDSLKFVIQTFSIYKVTEMFQVITE